MKTVFGVYPNRNRYTLASAGVLMLMAMPGWAVTPVEVAKLVADDGATNDFFGFSVAISGDTAVIRAARDDDKGNDSGSAYVSDINRDDTIDEDLGNLAAVEIPNN